MFSFSGDEVPEDTEERTVPARTSQDPVVSSAVSTAVQGDPAPARQEENRVMRHGPRENLCRERPESKPWPRGSRMQETAAGLGCGTEELSSCRAERTSRELHRAPETTTEAKKGARSFFFTEDPSHEKELELQRQRRKPDRRWPCWEQAPSLNPSRGQSGLPRGPPEDTMPAPLHSQPPPRPDTTLHGGWRVKAK